MTATLKTAPKQGLRALIDRFRCWPTKTIAEAEPTVWRLNNGEEAYFTFDTWRGKELPFMIRCRVTCRGESTLIMAACRHQNALKTYTADCPRCGALLTVTIGFMKPASTNPLRLQHFKKRKSFSSLIKQVISNRGQVKIALGKALFKFLLGLATLASMETVEAKLRKKLLTIN